MRGSRSAAFFTQIAWRLFAKSICRGEFRLRRDNRRLPDPRQEIESVRQTRDGTYSFFAPVRGRDSVRSQGSSKNFEGGILAADSRKARILGTRLSTNQNPRVPFRKADIREMTSRIMLLLTAADPKFRVWGNPSYSSHFLLRIEPGRLQGMA